MFHAEILAEIEQTVRNLLAAEARHLEAAAEARDAAAETVKAAQHHEARAEEVSEKADAWATVLRNIKSTPPVSGRPKVTRPPYKPGEEFFALVAAAYRDYATRSNGPAIAIAQEAGVASVTARKWVQEARRRGYLPPGHRGQINAFFPHEQMPAAA